ncbi:MAG: MerR family transcriptional regulator [Armatimonadota bacterium]|nr:MerR family transcriptional regulator [Armatimonadota bacterium]
MNDIPNPDSLLWEALPDLTLNIAQTANLCGISVRQLGYWTRQGYVTAQGRGARRTYGLEAVRRLLAIRKAMDSGLSLRQALRQVPASLPGASPIPAAETSEQASSDAPESMPLSAEKAEALAGCLREFFQANRHVRGHAAGLAVKLGRAEEDVRVVAEALCRAGILAKNICQGMTIFQPAGQEATCA